MPPNRFIEVFANGGTCWQVQEDNEYRLKSPEGYVDSSGWLVLDDIDGTNLYIHPRDIIAWELSTPETRANAKALQAQIDAELEEPRLPWEK